MGRAFIGHGDLRSIRGVIDLRGLVDGAGRSRLGLGRTCRVLVLRSKAGQQETQIRPLGVKTGQYPA